MKHNYSSNTTTTTISSTQQQYQLPTARYDISQVTEEIVNHFVVDRGEPLIIGNVMRDWNNNTFNLTWIKERYSNIEITVRINSIEKHWTLGQYIDFINQSKSNDDHHHSNNHKLHSTHHNNNSGSINYKRDIPCPPEWKSYIMDDNKIPSYIRERGTHDMVSELPLNRMPNTTHVGVDGDDLWSPGQREPGGAIGHSLMVNCADPSTSVTQWMCTGSRSKDQVLKLWQEKLNGHIDNESKQIYLPLTDFINNGIQVHVFQQKYGDLVILPSCSVYQYNTAGGFSIKVTWNRVTPQSLGFGYEHVLPLYRTIKKKDVFSIKQIAFYGLHKRMTILDNYLKNNNNGNNTMLVPTNQHPMFSTVCELVHIHRIVQDIAFTESVDTSVLANERKATECRVTTLGKVGDDLQRRTCTGCNTFIFNRFYSCEDCYQEASKEKGNGYCGSIDICLNCVPEGVVCKHKNCTLFELFPSTDVDQMLVTSLHLAQLILSQTQQYQTRESILGLFHPITPDTFVSSGTVAFNHVQFALEEEKSTCHQCKLARPRNRIAFCSCIRPDKSVAKVPTGNNPPKPKKEKLCQKKYCSQCLSNRYSKSLVECLKEKKWRCLFCSDLCNCSACMKKRKATPGSTSTTPIHFEKKFIPAPQQAIIQQQQQHNYHPRHYPNLNFSDQLVGGATSPPLNYEFTMNSPPRPSVPLVPKLAPLSVHNYTDFAAISPQSISRLSPHGSITTSPTKLGTGLGTRPNRMGNDTILHSPTSPPPTSIFKPLQSPPPSNSSSSSTNNQNMLSPPTPVFFTTNNNNYISPDKYYDYNQNITSQQSIELSPPHLSHDSSFANNGGGNSGHNQSSLIDSPNPSSLLQNDDFNTYSGIYNLNQVDIKSGRKRGADLETQKTKKSPKKSEGSNTPNLTYSPTPSMPASLLQQNQQQQASIEGFYEEKSNQIYDLFKQSGASNDFLLQNKENIQKEISNILKSSGDIRRLGSMESTPSSSSSSSYQSLSPTFSSPVLPNNNNVVPQQSSTTSQSSNIGYSSIVVWLYYNELNEPYFVPGRYALPFELQNFQEYDLSTSSLVVSFGSDKGVECISNQNIFSFSTGTEVTTPNELALRQAYEYQNMERNNQIQQIVTSNNTNNNGYYNGQSSSSLSSDSLNFGSININNNPISSCNPTPSCTPTPSISYENINSLHPSSTNVYPSHYQQHPTFNHSSSSGTVPIPVNINNQNYRSSSSSSSSSNTPHQSHRSSSTSTYLPY